jgi:hypothetical protein
MNATRFAPSTPELFELAHRDLGFSNDDLAMVLGTTTRMVERCRSGLISPSPAALDRLRALDHIRTRLYGVYEVHDALAWLRSPNEHLTWLSPAAALRSGNLQRVEHAIDQIGYRPFR